MSAARAVYLKRFYTRLSFSLITYRDRHYKRRRRRRGRPNENRSPCYISGCTMNMRLKKMKKNRTTDYDDVHQLNRRVPDDYDDDESAVKRTRARATENQLLNREIRKRTWNTNENTFGGAITANDDGFSTRLAAATVNNKRGRGRKKNNNKYARKSLSRTHNNNNYYYYQRVYVCVCVCVRRRRRRQRKKKEHTERV